MDGKRRLPLWMVGGVSAADKESKSLDIDTINIEVKDKVSVAIDRNQSKLKGRTRRRKEEALGDEESSFLVKCETKRRKRGVFGKDAIGCDESKQENGAEKRKRGRVGRKVEVPAPPRKKKPKSSGFESNDENESPSPDEDEGDLTMEDMLNISKEVEESNFLVKCETKRRKRGGIVKDAIDCDEGMQENEAGKRKRGRSGRTAPPGMEHKESSVFESDEIEAPFSDEDNGDLTMEDMLSIAKEFVEDDNEKGKRKSSECEGKAKDQFVYPASSKREMISSSIVTPDTISPTHEAAASRQHSTENMTSKDTIVGSTMTGDPAQDMLDLFLGPLLKKPIGKSEKFDSITDDVIFNHGAKKQQQDVIVSKEPVVFTKKKSSLRNMVAMLLE